VKEILQERDFSRSIEDREKPNTNILTIIATVDMLTRYTEKLEFKTSMSILHHVGTLEYYDGIRDMEPYQFQLMRRLGISNPSDTEPMENVLRRQVIKQLDRISLMRETERRYTEEQVSDLEYLFETDESLRKVYGYSIDFQGEGRPYAFRIAEMLRTTLVTNYLHKFLNEYLGQIEDQADQNSNEFLQVLKYLRNLSPIETVKLSERTVRGYVEKINGQVEDGFAEGKLEKFRNKLDQLLESDTTYATSIISGGLVDRAIIHDNSLHDGWGKQDTSIREKMLQNMEDAEEFGVLHGRFYSPVMSDGKYYVLEHLDKWGVTQLISTTKGLSSTPPNF